MKSLKQSCAKRKRKRRSDSSASVRSLRIFGRAFGESSIPEVPDGTGFGRSVEMRSTILDGEIVALDAEGIPRFQLLQQWQKRPTAPVVYFLFDLLWCDGRDLTGKTVLQRRKRLRRSLLPSKESNRQLHRELRDRSVPARQGERTPHAAKHATR